MSQQTSRDQPEENTRREADGGRATIQTPSECTPELMHPGIALTSGVDSLSLALDMRWQGTRFFETLHALQEEARSNKRPATGQLQTKDQLHALVFQVEEHGYEGYRWILNCPEWSIRLGAWTEPKLRPNAMVTFRSEYIWLYGIVECIDRLFELLKSVGGYVVKAKASRIDVCVDVQIPEEFWRIDLIHHKVGPIKKSCVYFDFDELSGFRFAKGDLVARLYDKPREIAQCSHKTWMYDLWRIQEVPEGQRIIRVEFQIRREILKQLAVDTVWDFVHYPRSLWDYCAQRWLVLAQDRTARKKHRKILPFWETVQNGFLGGQSGAPFIRAKLVNIKRKQLAQQLIGQATSLVAMQCDTSHPSLRIEDQSELVKECAEQLGMSDAAFSERVRAKLAKRTNELEKFDMAQAQRAASRIPQWKTEDGKVA